MNEGKMSVCKECGGSGKIYRGIDDDIACPTCNGTGSVAEQKAEVKGVHVTDEELESLYRQCYEDLKVNTEKLLTAYKAKVIAVIDKIDVQEISGKQGNEDIAFPTEAINIVISEITKAVNEL